MTDTTAKNETITSEFLWIKGQQAGFDPQSDKWRAKGGQFVSRDEAMGERHPELVYGSTVRFDIAPLSRKLDYFEMNVLGSLSPKMIRELSRAADFMPTEIAASMKLSEYYTRTEGDLWQTVVVPIQMALRPIVVESSDKAVEQELREIYDGLDMDSILLWQWLCVDIYGQSFPLEVWENNTPTGIVILDPKYMKVGRQISLTPSVSIVPPDGSKWGSDTWSEAALEQQIHPMVYHSFASGWNEQAASGNDVPLDPSRCRMVSDFKLPFQRYAIPSISRCFRPLATRQILEEMQRATIEGFRNQLWVFKLGTDQTPTHPNEIAHFRAQLGGMAGERTGILVWRHTLSVEQHAPKSLDVLLGNEMWLALTLHIYRQRGMSLRIITGESPGSRASDIEWEVKTYMERQKFQKNQILGWERGLRAKIAEARGPAWKKAKTRVSMVRTDIETEHLVKTHLQPLGQAGWLSLTTLLQESGHDYNVELARKQEEEPNAHLFTPKPTFAQATTFNVPKEVQEVSPGRPPGATDKEPREQKMEGSITVWAQEQRFDDYLGQIFNLFDQMVESPSQLTIDTFIDGTKGINTTFMMQYAADGYASAGGAYAVDPAWIKGAINFNNGYAEKFRDDLYAALDAGQDLSTFAWRVYLYPQEGRHLAHMWGVQQAMKEYGARGWRRVLHPELSEQGPCQQCIDDSFMIHPIDEGFWEPHPHGRCSAISIAYYTRPTEVPIEIPVPQKFTLPEQIRSLLERLGRIGKTIVRRVRGK